MKYFINQNLEVEELISFRPDREITLRTAGNLFDIKEDAEMIAKKFRDEVNRYQSRNGKFYIDIFGNVRSARDLSIKEQRNLSVRNRLFETEEEASKMAEAIEDLLTDKFLQSLRSGTHECEESTEKQSRNGHSTPHQTNQ